MKGKALASIIVVVAIAVIVIITGVVGVCTAYIHPSSVDASINISPDPFYLGDGMVKISINVTKAPADTQGYVLIDTFLAWENMTFPPLILEKNKKIKIGESWQHNISEKILETFVGHSCEVTYAVNINLNGVITEQKRFYFYNYPRPTPTPMLITPITSVPELTPTPSPTPPLTPPVVTPTPTPTPPGFEAVFAITGLLAVAYLLRKRK